VSVVTARRDLAGQWSATVFVAAISMLLSFALGRALGPEGYGSYSYALSWAVIFAVVQDGGFRTLLFREGVAPTPALQESEGTLVRSALGHAGMVTLLGIAAIVTIPLRDRNVLLAAVVCMGLTAVMGFVSARLKAAGRFRAEAGWQALARLLSAACVAIVLLLPDASPMRVLVGLSAGLALALGLPVARRQLGAPRLHWSAGVYRSCAAFLVIDAGSAVYFRIDMVLLRHLAPGAGEVGLYAAAHRFIEAAVLLAVPAAHVGFRALRLRWEEPRAFRRLLVLMLVATVAVAAMAVAAGHGLGEPILRATFGPEFVAAARPLTWLLLALLFMLPNAILTQGMIAINREWAYAAAAVAAAVVNCGLNFWLIPRHGAVGAAWAALATEAYLFACLAFAHWRWSSVAVSRRSSSDLRASLDG
jgi:O-antigen/teichoic acid export membrane protein